MADISNYVSDIKTYFPAPDEGAVAKIVAYCGIALRNADSSLVSASDSAELATVRDGFAAKKLGLSAEAADAGIKKVAEQMKGVKQKSRVTFYYLLAEATGTMDKLG
jgi:hypothetical protein